MSDHFDDSLFDHLDDPTPPPSDYDGIVARGRSLRRRRQIALSAAGALLLVAVAGTGFAVLRPDNDSTALVPASPSVTSVAPSVTPVPPTAATPPAPSSTPSPTAAGPPYCATSELTVMVGGPSDAAAGTRSTYVLFTNDGSDSCVLNGHPGVSYVQADQQVGAPAVRDDATERITLAPGAVAHARLLIGSYQNYDPAACEQTTVDGYRVYPPDQTESVIVPAPGTACANEAIALLRIGTVLPGVPTDPEGP